MNSTDATPEARSLADDAGHLIDRAAGAASGKAHRGLDAVLDGAHRVRDTVRHAGDNASDYIRHDPLKAVLVAAGAGALLALLVSLLARRRH
jgi:ElaB/YqjD/DUF883 family membrane-anchored ribosome-binding protein